MKKKIAVLLVGLCAISLLGGCGKDSDTKTESSGNEGSGSGTSAYNAADYVTLGEYKGIEITISDYSVSDADIRESVENMIAAYPAYEKTDKTTIENGDFVDFDYEGIKDGVAFDGGTEAGKIMQIGSGGFIEGFEEGMIGANVGETIDLNLTFPEDYQSEDLAGQDVVFHVTINEIVTAKEMSYDTLTEEYVTEKFGYETVQAFLDSAKEELTNNNAYYEQSEKQSAIIEKVKEICSVTELPEGLLDQRVNDYKEQFEANCKEQYDMEVADYLEQNYGMTEEDFNTQTVEYMKDNLNTEFILEAIAQNEGIEVDEEGFETYLTNMISTYSYESKEALYEQYDEDYLRTSYLCNKALELVTENAVVSYTAAEEDETAGEADGEETDADSEASAGETEDSANAEETEDSAEAEGE